MRDFFCENRQPFFLKVVCLKEPSALIAIEMSTLSVAFTAGFVAVAEHLQHEPN